MDLKLVETIRRFRDIQPSENYLEPIVKPYDEQPIIVQEADIFRETYTELLKK